MTVLIRPADESGADDRAIGELLVQSFTEAYADKMPEVVVTEARREELRAVAARRRDARVLVAVADTGVVGTLAVYGPGHPESKSWRDDAAEIRYLAIDLGRRGDGTASRLLVAAQDEMRDRGVRQLTLHVRRGAAGVARFYERHGYRRVPNGDRDQLPAIYLEGYALDLQSPTAGASGERNSV